jgi:hypothetical protein
VSASAAFSWVAETLKSATVLLSLRKLGMAVAVAKNESISNVKKAFISSEFLLTSTTTVWRRVYLVMRITVEDTGGV